MSGVGEMIASSVARQVASKLGDLAVEEATLLWRFKDDVNDMKEKMRDLVAVMQDADDTVRQVGKDGAVARRWLAKVKSVAYDVEDVLDEFDAAQLIRNHQSKKMTIARNMKNLRDKIVAIEKDCKMLNLVRHEPHAKGSRSNGTFTVSDDMEIGMLGRDAETEKIISLLLKTEAKEDISIIPIVGLGGLGKTTLAQAVFADKRVSVFDMKIWVYVSEDFDLLKIGKAIIRGANRSISLDNCNLQFVQDNLIKELANRRYLIVLDDLWEEYGENLEKLKQMLQHGGKGSKIIVTTRNGSVVQVLHTGCLANQRKICPVHEADHINLDVLSPDDCWKVMKQRIFGPDDDQSGLEEIGRQIAGRCGGLPLVANALGQVMSEQRTIEAWRDIRDRKIVLDFIVDNRRDTLERLLLSFYYMKPDYKMCFTCLASFLKGFVVDSDRLILQWSALGYIQARHTGQSCIDYLLGMSFLQISKSSSISPVHAKAPRKLTMHDLVYDLAKIIAADEVLVMDANKPTTWDKANELEELPESIHNLKCLQHLDISGCCALQKLPDKFGSLPKLSFVNLSGCSKLTKLPDSLNFVSLEHLILSDCHELEKLPEDLGNLYRLEVLDMSDCYRVQGGEAERRWLNKLKSVAYDVEDVLDELDAAQLIKNHQPKLKLFLSRNNPLLRKMTIAHNMKNLREKIVAIKNDSIKLHLVHREPVTEGSRGNETFADDSDMDIGMLGRDAETKKIISLLLNTEAKEDISIIPIVGLGGLGKTTLAQAVFADERVNVFDMRIWVYVSKEFDLLKIGKAIIRGANRSINLDNCNLQFVKDNLKKELANRRYLIVLDDLWEEYGENLEKLKQMLQHGGKGSKIIATTRSGSVVQVLYTGYLANERKVCPVPEPDHINLGVLSTDDCWMVMKRRVFGPDDEEIGLEQIGRQIASRCGGLPLVANALGQIMSEHRSIEAWTDIRDRKIALDFKADHQQDTLERLMLSYYYMKREFKMCFTYLAAFSKGFVMHTDRLIQQWRALGYIGASDDGQRCIHYLLGMSFLQISKSSLLVNYQKQSRIFKDLPSKVRTFHFRQCNGMQLPPKAFTQAKYIRILDMSGFSFEGHSTPRSIVMPSSIRKLMLLAYLDVSGLPIIALPKYFHTLQNMQTLILSNCSLETLPANMGNLHKLCCLDLSRNNDLTELPTSFENLLNLSLLNLSGCSKLEELPESVHNLKCLQQLDMSGCCALQKLPSKFGILSRLSFLQVLDLTGCYGLPDLPDSISGMTSLTMLDVDAGPDDVFIKAETIQECLNLPGIVEHDVHKLENGECSSVVELGRLCCRALHVQHLENVECLEDAMKAKLRDMTELRKLILSWGLDGTQNVDNNKLVLENLLPPRTLEKLGYDPGVAIFGGGPIYLGEGLPEFTTTLEYTPLVAKRDSPAYYVTANAVALEDTRLPLPRGALAAGGVALRTTVPFGQLRPDVFRPFVRDFEKGLNRSDAKVAAVAPFPLCYRASMLGITRNGYPVPAVTLMLAGGKNYTMTGNNLMVNAKGDTACLAFVEMKGAGDAGSPAVILGGFQMENMLLQFDSEKKRLGFARLPFYTSCSNFNFTKTQ
uniref:Peptidase A1 domain-containing protein n=1 Tax=Oryza glumipatula TaxID=40148 RepID=A0A0D9YJT0_9ORYZ